MDRLRLTGPGHGRLLLAILPVTRSANESHANGLIMLYSDRYGGGPILECRSFFHPVETSAVKTLNSILVYIAKKLYKHVEPF
jgi:hypothetical protein